MMTATPMKICLLYSQGAGDGAPLRELRRKIEDAGHTIARVARTDTDLQAALDDAVDLVVAAGGDGTVGRAARALAGRKVDLAVLPLGTANNVARSLGIPDTLDEAIAGWTGARRQTIDLGIAQGGWGERHFIEGAGIGLIPAGILALRDVLHEDDGNPEGRLGRARRGFRDVAADLASRPCTVTADAERIEGDFLAIEVLNVPAVGPNLVFSPDADPSDGLLTVVIAEQRHRQVLAEYLKRKAAGESAALALPVRQARTIEIVGGGQVHVDDDLPTGGVEGRVSFRVDPAALRILSGPVQPL